MSLLNFSSLKDLLFAQINIDSMFGDWDIRPVILASLSFVFLLLFKLEIFDFETTLIGFLILIIFGFNAIIVLLVQVRDKE